MDRKPSGAQVRLLGEEERDDRVVVQAQVGAEPARMLVLLERAGYLVKDHGNVYVAIGPELVASG